MKSLNKIVYNGQYINVCKQVRLTLSYNLTKGVAILNFYPPSVLWRDMFALHLVDTCFYSC